MLKTIIKKIKTLVNLNLPWAGRYYSKKLARNLDFYAAGLRKDYEEVDIDGLKIKMSFSHSTQYSFAKKIKNKRHEHDLLVMWKRNLELGNADGDILDLGGYSGIFGLIAAKLNPSRKVYIFEPDPVNIHHIESNIALNDLSNILLVKGAVSDKTGQVFFKEHAGGESGSIADQGGLSVNSYSLGDFIESNDIKPALIKMDVEGAEYLALSGLKEYFRKNNDVSILLELHCELVKKYGNTQKDVFKLLGEMGFKYIYLDESRYSEHYWAYPAR